MSHLGHVAEKHIFLKKENVLQFVKMCAALIKLNTFAMTIIVRKCERLHICFLLYDTLWQASFFNCNNSI